MFSQVVSSFLYFTNAIAAAWVGQPTFDSDSMPRTPTLKPRYRSPAKILRDYRRMDAWFVKRLYSSSFPEQADLDSSGHDESNNEDSSVGAGADDESGVAFVVPAKAPLCAPAGA